jgi:hypothetical protein
LDSLIHQQKFQDLLKRLLLQTKGQSHEAVQRIQLMDSNLYLSGTDCQNINDLEPIHADSGF